MKETRRYNLLTGLIQVDLKNGKYIEHSDHLKEVEQLQARIKELIAALQLSKDMFIANDLILPHTFDVIDDALNGAASDKAINEIKAQGIEEAIKKADNETYIGIVGQEFPPQSQYKAELLCYAEQLRTKHD